jgi:hypothetical protein
MIQNTLQCEHKYELYTEIKKLFHAGAQRLHTNYYGPKIYTDLQRLALLILRTRCGYTYKRFCDEYLPESNWPRKLGLQELPSSASVWRWSQRFDMSFLRKLNDQLLLDEKPEVLAIDGTGLDADSKTAHYAQRIHAPMKKGPKLDIIVDTDTLLVHDWSVLIKPRHDAYVAKRLLNRTAHSAVLILADKGYDSEGLYRICYEKGNRLWAPIKNAPYSDKPPKKLGRYKKHSHKQETVDYHRRNLVESTIRSIKNRVRALRARQHFMKKRELALHILVRNIEIKISLLLRLVLARKLVLVRFAHTT